VRRQAISAISSIGQKNDEIIAAVKTAVNDPDSRVRERANFAASSLGIDLNEPKKEVIEPEAATKKEKR